MGLKVYLFLYTYLNEVSVNLVIFRFKISKPEVFGLLARLILKKAQRYAIGMTDDDFWLLQDLAKHFTDEKYRHNPWRYQSTMEENWSKNDASKINVLMKLRTYENSGIAESKSGSNNRRIWRLTEFGQKVLDAVTYIQWKCPQIHHDNK